jgi:hypothetical protein
MAGNQSNAVAGCLGFFLGPVGLWYKGQWAAGFAWLAMIVIVGLATGGLGIVLAPVFWIGMTIHAIVAEPRTSPLLPESRRCSGCGVSIQPAASFCPACGVAVPKSVPTLQGSNNRTALKKLLMLSFIGFVAYAAYDTIKRQPAQTGGATPTASPEESATTSSTPIEVASPQRFPRATSVATPNAFDSHAATPTPAPGTYLVIGISKGDYLNVREGAGSNYPVVTRLKPSTGGIVLGTKRVANGATTWQEITVDGETGWVNADYIAPTTPASESPTQ